MERVQSSVHNCRTGAVELRAGAASVTGRVHEELGDGNEDGYIIDRQHFVFALYDTHVCSLATMNFTAPHQAPQGPQAPAVLKLIGDTIPSAFAEFLNRPPAEKEAALRRGLSSLRSLDYARR